MMNDEIQFSEEAYSDDVIKVCNPGIIPIFPLRFALTGDALLRMQNSKDSKALSSKGNPLGTPLPPKSIHHMPDHELVRIRRGYVYVLANDVLQVFRFETFPQDENASIYHPGTDTSHKPPYTFTKYEFTGVDSRSKWKLLNESYPYLFVPHETKKAWIAYSETRWPYLFFDQIQKDETLRYWLMTEVNLETREGDYCAPITELEKRVPAFRKDSVEYKIKDYSLENAIRFTSVEIESPHKIIDGDLTREKGVLVALHDAVGEIQDFLGLMSVHSMTMTNFLSENQYPLIIGEAVNQYVVEDKVATDKVYNIWDGELSDDFATKYKQLKAKSREMEATQIKLGKHWSSLISRDLDLHDGPHHDQKGSFFWLIASCERIFKGANYNPKQNPKDHTELIAYNLFLWSRVMASTAISPILCSPLSELFSNKNYEGPSIWAGDLSEYMSDVLSLAASAIEIGQKVHDNFTPSLNAVFSVYGTQVVEVYNRTNGLKNGVTELVQLMFREERRIRNASDLTSIYQEMLAAEGYPGAVFPEMTDRRGQRAHGVTLITDPAYAGQIDVIEFHAQVQLEVSDEYLAFARRANNFDLAINGFGLVAAGLSVSATLHHWNDPIHARTVAGKIIGNPSVIVATAFADAANSTYEITTALVGRSNTAATNRVLTTIFNDSHILSTAAASNAGRGAVHSISPRLLQVAAKASNVIAVIGFVMSSLAVVEGVARGDKAMVIGNGLMAAGTLVLLFVATGPLAIAAVIAIAIGAAISFLSYDDHERWVKDGFWGTSKYYWKAVRDPNTTSQIEDAKVLGHPDPKSEKYNRIKTFFDQEVATLLDINSMLFVEDEKQQDGQIEIECATLQSTEDLKRLSVKMNMDPGAFRSPYYIEGIKNKLVTPGRVLVTIPQPKKLQRRFKENQFNINVELQRIFYEEQDGKFTKTLTTTAEELWGG